MTLRIVAALGLALFFLGLFLGHATAQTSRSPVTYDFAPVRIPAAPSSQPTPSVSMPGQIT